MAPLDRHCHPASAADARPTATARVVALEGKEEDGGEGLVSPLAAALPPLEEGEATATVAVGRGIISERRREKERERKRNAGLNRPAFLHPSTPPARADLPPLLFSLEKQGGPPTGASRTSAHTQNAFSKEEEKKINKKKKAHLILYPHLPHRPMASVNACVADRSDAVSGSGTSAWRAEEGCMGGRRGGG